MRVHMKLRSCSNAGSEPTDNYSTDIQNERILGEEGVMSVTMCIWVMLLVAAVFVGCSTTEDFANPLDPENPRTAGSPTGLRTISGDAHVTVMWEDLGLEGIAEYRIYRRFTGDADPKFKLVGEVDASTTQFIDTQDIENDQFDFTQGVPHVYIYRISYVDANGIEVPNPENPPDPTAEPPRFWPTSSVTPSVPPPAPVITLGTPSDLTVKLIWDDYQFPDDFERFEVFGAVARGDGSPLDFRLLATLGQTQTFFFDQDFSQDNVTKVYRVVAVDRFGAEGTTTLEGTSPNIPPPPPQNVRLQIAIRSLANDRYDAIISWTPSRVRDLAGYQIYSTRDGGDVIARNTVDPDDSLVTIIGETPIRIGQDLVLRQYFISAFDNTPNAAGQRDESPTVEAVQLQ